MGGNSSKVVHFSDYGDQGFWRGPYGILVSNQIAAILTEDQCNYIIRPGNVRTNAYTANTPLNYDQFMEKYGEKHFNNYYYDLEKGEKDVREHRIFTKNRRGKPKVYVRMLDGVIFKETSRGVKTIKPVPYKRR